MTTIMEAGAISGTYPGNTSDWNVGDVGQVLVATPGVSAGWSGNSNWNANFTHLRIKIVPLAGTQFNISLDQLDWQVGRSPSGAVMMNFDDGLDDVYDEAFAYMKTKRAKGTFFINTSLPGTAGNVTVAQLQEMDAAGWAIGNHSDNTASLTAYDQATATSHIQAAQASLDGWGLTKASLHLAYPNFNFNDTVIAACQDAGILSARCGATGKRPYLESNFDQRYVYPCRVGITSGTTLADMQAVMDSAYYNGLIVIYVIHSIGPTANITVANLQALIDYGVSLKLPFLTVVDFYNLLSETVTVPIA